MSDGLMSAVQGLGSAEKRLESIASNLANLNVTGFKRSATASQSFDQVLGGRLERRVTTRRVTDFSQGTLTTTGNPYDLGLHGAGFFALEGKQGELYSREGRFFVDEKGVLQTLDGMPVVWEGPRGTIDPAGAEVTVDNDANVRQGEQEVGRLRVVDFDRPQALTVDKSGMFAAPADRFPIPSSAEVRQGQREEANVSAIDELVALIAVQRQFESGTRLMSTIDQSYRRLTTPR